MANGANDGERDVVSMPALRRSVERVGATVGRGVTVAVGPSEARDSSGRDPGLRRRARQASSHCHRRGRGSASAFSTSAQRGW